MWVFCFTVADKQLSPEDIQTRTHTDFSSLPSPSGKSPVTLEGTGRKQQEQRTDSYIWFCFVSIKYFAKRFMARSFGLSASNNMNPKLLSCGGWSCRPAL